MSILFLTPFGGVCNSQSLFLRKIAERPIPYITSYPIVLITWISAILFFYLARGKSSGWHFMSSQSNLMKVKVMTPNSCMSHALANLRKVNFAIFPSVIYILCDIICTYSNNTDLFFRRSLLHIAAVNSKNSKTYSINLLNL